MSEGDNPDAAKRTVFVSYSRDNRDAVLPIIRALETSGIGVWWDGLLVGGDRFAKTTETALETADAVIVAWTARSIESHWVRDEATRGRDRGCMISLSLDGSVPPLGFRQIQYIDFGKWHGKTDSPAFRELLAAIEVACTSPGSALSYADAAAKKAGVSRRAAMLGGGAAVVLAGGTFAAWRAGLFGSAAASNSIAVLAFKNLSGDPDEDYFSDGLSEELRATLSFNPELEVAAQASSNVFRDGKASMEDIAGKLGVAFILDGSVRRSGSQLRVTARLVNGRTGFEQWSQIFEHTLADVLAVQRDIATLVVDALLANFAKHKDEGPVRIGGTKNEKALDAYFRGEALYSRSIGEESDRAALAAFEEAIRLDPNYAAAQAAVSRAATAVGSSYATGDELAGYYDQAMTAAKRAVELAPDLAEGHSALGFVLMSARLDMTAAREPFQRSFELGYGNAPVLTLFANYSTYVKRFEDSRAAIARAERLDPLNPLVFRSASTNAYFQRNFDTARQSARTALSIDPTVNIAHRVLGDIAYAGGDYRAAREEYLKEPSVLSQLRSLAIVDAKLSGVAEGEKSLAKLVELYGDNSLYQQAEILAQWGRRDEALTALEQGYEAGDAGLVLMQTDPMLDPIRHEPRFTAILGRLAFT